MRPRSFGSLRVDQAVATEVIKMLGPPLGCRQRCAIEQRAGDVDAKRRQPELGLEEGRLAASRIC